MNIAEVLRDRAAQMSGAPAIIERDRTTTFGELERHSARVAEQLTAAGVGRGDAVLVICPMSAVLYEVLIGLWRAGAVAVVLDPSAGREHIERCCRMVPPRAIVAVPRAHLLRLVSSALRRVPLRFVVSGWVPGARRLRPDSGEPLEAIAAADDGTQALLTFTSGSTGAPKAAVRTHGFLLSQHQVLAEELRLRPGQRDLSTLPIFVLANLASGVSSVIPDADMRRPGEVDPVPVLRQIRALNPGRVAASPAFLDRLASHAASRNQPIEQLREVYTGGAPVFPVVLRRLRLAMPRASVYAVYGSTEAEPIAKVTVDEISSEDFEAMASGAGLLAGQPVAFIDLRVVEDRWGTPIGPLDSVAFDRQTLPPTEIGEIVVAGPHVLSGYLDGAGDAETKLRVNGRVWHRTGDAGYLDPRGRLWLMGRCSARIADVHGVIYPFAVECAALETPGIRRCALISVAGRRVLVVEVERTASDVGPGVLARLAWAQLAEVRVVTSLPVDRRHNAKVDYSRLARLIRE